MQDVQELVLLGIVDSAHVHVPATEAFSREAVPRSRLEREATAVDPPPRGQDIRSPIDGVCIM
jgi:hypothetical protein